MAKTGGVMKAQSDPFRRFRWMMTPWGILLVPQIFMIAVIAFVSSFIASSEEGIVSMIKTIFIEAFMLTFIAGIVFPAISDNEETPKYLFGSYFAAFSIALTSSLTVWLTYCIIIAAKELSLILLSIALFASIFYITSSVPQVLTRSSVKKWKIIILYLAEFILLTFSTLLIIKIAIT